MKDRVLFRMYSLKERGERTLGTRMDFSVSEGCVKTVKNWLLQSGHVLVIRKYLAIFTVYLSM